MNKQQIYNMLISNNSSVVYKNDGSLMSFNTFRQKYNYAQLQDLIQPQQTTQTQQTQQTTQQINNGDNMNNNNTQQPQPDLNQIMQLMQQQQQQINQLMQQSAQQPQTAQQPQQQTTQQPQTANVGYSPIGSTNMSMDYSILVNRVSGSTMDKLLTNATQQPNIVLVAHRVTNNNGKPSGLTVLVDTNNGNVYKPKFIIDNQTGEPTLVYGFPQTKQKFTEFLFSGSNKTGKNPYNLPSHTLNAISNYILYHC